MELVFVLIAMCALLTPGAFSKSKNKRNVLVRSELPGYIEFCFTLDDSFQPQSLTATPKGSNKIILFTRTALSDRITFRNTEEQYFQINDILFGSLFYKFGTELPAHNTSLRYTIDENSNMLTFNTQRPPKKIDNADNPVHVNSGNSVNNPTDTEFKLPYKVRAQDAISHTDPSCENLKEMLNTVLKYVDIRTRLLLRGHKPLDTNAVDVIRKIVVEELKLTHLQNKILQAKFAGENILFEMSGGEDVLQILTQIRLMPNSFDIIMTDVNFF